MLTQKAKEVDAQVRQFVIESKDTLEAFRLRFVSKKGIIPELFEQLKSASIEEKKTLGKTLNELKQLAEAKLKDFTEKLNEVGSNSSDDLDLTLPVIPNKTGNLHPLTLTRLRIIDVFERLGFSVSDGPEIEDD
ncbi:MAG: phenylalanine--tRNA ligase subunit alpha, partial [Bacteroidota bacterium]